ncbi:MAG: superoxide dismutase [Deltaproteobacteria bacterium]|nr:superoxide dismutase [Deltaproteobacteria bacterium]
MYTLPALQYGYSALEPYIDAQTMEIHYNQHHQTYVNKLNEAVEKFPDLAKKSVDELLRHLELVPNEIRTAVKNNGGGHANHSFFWTILGGRGELVKGPFADAVTKLCGSVDAFKKEFTNAATGSFGSGWVWLVAKQNKSLEIITTPNQDSPLMAGNIPILGLDLWEHAYYLKYQNRKPEYISAFWNVIQWSEVERRLVEATK